MPISRLEQFEIHAHEYRVEKAPVEAEAHRQDVSRRRPSRWKQSQDFIRGCRTGLRLPGEEAPGACRSATGVGRVAVWRAVIPSIRKHFSKSSSGQRGHRADKVQGTSKKARTTQFRIRAWVPE